MASFSSSSQTQMLFCITFYKEHETLSELIEDLQHCIPHYDISAMQYFPDIEIPDVM